MCSFYFIRTNGIQVRLFFSNKVSLGKIVFLDSHLGAFDLYIRTMTHSFTCHLRRGKGCERLNLLLRFDRYVHRTAEVLLPQIL